MKTDIDLLSSLAAPTALTRLFTERLAARLRLRLLLMLQPLLPLLPLLVCFHQNVFTGPA